MNALHHDQKQIEKVTGMNCEFYFTKINHYTKEMMLTEGIPFIVEGKQMFFPFLGMLLADDIGLENKVGMSALCEYSLLSDNTYPTYAITKKELTDTSIKSY